MSKTKSIAKTAVAMADEVLRIYSLFDMGKSLIEMYKGKFNNFKNLFVKAYKTAVDNVLKNYSNESTRTFLKRCREIGDISNYENLYKYLYKINNDMENLLQEEDIEKISSEITRQLNCLVLNDNEYKLLYDLLSYHQLNNISFRLNELNDIITCLLNSINNDNNLKNDNNIFARTYNERLCMHSVGEISISLSDIFVMPDVKNKHGVSNALEAIREFVNNKNQHVFFLEGFGGYGKSSIVSYLAYNYLFNRSSPNIDFLNNRQLVIIRLRDIDLNNIIKGIQDKLNNAAKLSGNAVLIFDGLDELCLIENKSDGNNISESIILEFLKDSRKIIITSRPTYIKYNELMFAPNINYLHTELVAFDEVKRKQFVNLFTRKDNNHSLAADFVKRLNVRENNSIYGSPFLLYLIMSGGIEEDEKDNSWKLLHRIFYKEMFKPMYNPSVRKLSEDEIDKIYQYNCDIAYEMFKTQNKKLSFTYNELSKLLPEPEYDSYEYVKKSHGLFSYMRYNNGAVEFVHNHVRDFFLCEKVLRTMSEWYEKDYNGEQIALELGNLLKYYYFEGQTQVFIKEALGSAYAGIKAKCTPEHLPKIFDLFHNAGGMLNYNYFYEIKEKSNVCFSIISTNVINNASYIYKTIYLDKGTQYINWFSMPVIFSDVLTMMSKNLNHAYLYNADLKDANLKGANLEYANLERVNLYNTNLKDANLRNSNLNCSLINNSNLSYADLSSVDFSTADVQSFIADYTKYNNDTKFPKYIIPQEPDWINLDDNH